MRELGLETIVAVRENQLTATKNNVQTILIRNNKAHQVEEAG